ncbi:MAG TPA: SRPBCC family protein [Frankiaceae bacterium]|nr:SRPBCC family protein [Frankiaceae bacterium]
MWSAEHRDETPAPTERVWQLMSDVASWSAWNPDVTTAEIDGPFEAGSTIRMQTASGDVIPLRLTEVTAGRQFVDEAEVDGITVRTDHRLEIDSDSGQTRVVYAVSITGEAPDAVLAEIGDAVSSDFPETIAGLVAAAAST